MNIDATPLTFISSYENTLYVIILYKRQLYTYHFLYSGVVINYRSYFHFFICQR